VVKFAAAGYVCIDYYPDFDNRYYVTGNGVDVLFNLLDMRGDLQSSIVSAVSDDEYGKAALEAFRVRNIDGSHLDIIPGGMTPRVPLHLINNDRMHGDPVRGVMQDYEFSQEAIDFICQHDMMHTDFTGKLIHRLPEIREKGVQVFFDLSNAHNHPDMDRVLSNIDYGLISFGDEVEKGKDFIRYACSKGAKLMVATFGEKGSIAYDGNRFYKGEIVPVERVVNTVGAGDSWFAGFISGIIDKKPVEECMYEGAKRSAQVISVFEPYFTSV